MANPFGIDISSYQANKEGTLKVNFDTMMSASNPPQFIGIRSGLGATFKDPQFAYNWAKAGEKSLPRIVYHVLEFGSDCKQQAEMFFARIKAHGLTQYDRLCLDLEVARSFDRNAITLGSLKAINRLAELTCRFPLIYSRASWINEHLIVSMLPKLDYWLAQYKYALPWPLFTTEFDSSKMAVPKGVEKSQIKIHQTGDKGEGKKYGMQSHYLDYDRFLGTQTQLLEWFGMSEHTEPEPELPPVLGTPLYKARVIADALNVRSTPEIANNKVDLLINGAVVDVYQTQGSWSRIGNNRWVSSAYLERIIDAPALNVTPYSQNDPRWKSIRLGTGNTTIGQEGCLVDAHCVAASAFGYVITPAEYNTWLIANKGFENGNWYVWNSLARRFPDLAISLWADCLRIPAPLHLMDAELAQGRPCVVWVDFNPDTAREEMHWVTIIGKLPDGDYTMVDSWDGWVGSFKSRYVSPTRYIFRIVSYKKG